MLKEERHYVRTMVEVSARISHCHAIMVAQPSRGVSPEDHPEDFGQKVENPCAVEVTGVRRVDSYWKSS
jgi:hypothetical protein